MNALIIVDVQYDFLPGGALEVKDGDQIIPIINSLQVHFDHVVATQDWHPLHHKSFAVNHGDRNPGEVVDLNGMDQILWPVHCVQGTRGASFSDELSKERIERVIVKGTNPEIDSYSGFFDNGKLQSTDMENYLKSRSIDQVYVVGLATDYCVKFTALDAVELGFDTWVISDATRAVNLSPNDFEESLEELRNAGVKVIKSKSLRD